MKERFKKIWENIKRKPMFWVFMILLLIYLPTAIIAPAENEKVAIVTGVGIDKSEEGIEFSVLTLLPQNSQTFSDAYKLVSAKGENIGISSGRLENFLGKQIDLSHAGYVVFGNEICKDGIINHMNALIKSNNIGSNALVMTTNTTAKEFFETIKNLDSNSGEKLKDIIFNNNENMLSLDTSIDLFYRGYLSNSKCSIINQINLVEENQEGIDASGGSSNGESGSSQQGAGQSSSKKPKRVSNDGSALILKNAKAEKELNQDQTFGLNIVDPGSYQGLFLIKNYETEEGNSIDVTFDIKNKKVKRYPKIENNKASIDFVIDLNVDVLQVENSDKDKIDKLPQKVFYDDQMKEKIKDKFVEDFFSVYNQLIEKDLDCLEIGQTLKRAGAKKYRHFVESLGENPNILQNVEISVDINVEME